MRITNMCSFVSGIIQLIIGVGLLITCICLNRCRTDRVMWIVLPTLCGIGNRIVNVETEAERRKRKAERKAELRKMFGGNNNE